MFKICHLTSFCFLGTQSGNKGYKTFSRKEVVVTKLLETGFGPKKCCPPEVLARLSLLLPCVSLLSLCSTMWDYLLSDEPSVLISEKPFLIICAVQGFVHMSLRSWLDWRGCIWIEMLACPSICLNWLSHQSLRHLESDLSLECDLEMASVASL